MKISILTLPLAITSVNYVAAAQRSHLRGDAPRGLGLLRDIVDSFAPGAVDDPEAKQPAPELINADPSIPELINSDNSADFDLSNLATLLENMAQLQGLLDIDMAQLKQIMEQMKTLMPLILPMLGNSEGFDLSAIMTLLAELIPAESNCSTECDCTTAPDFLVEVTSEPTCIEVQYSRPKPNVEPEEFQKRCFPQMFAALAVASNVYTCLPEEAANP